MTIGSSYHLLSDGKDVAKLKHGAEELRIESVGLYLAPSDTVEGLNLCPAASPDCRTDCLFNSGLAERFRSINEQRKARTEFFRDQYEAFMYLLVQDLERLERSADKHGTWPAARLNCTSDVNWINRRANRGGRLYDDLFQAFPDIQFYDYTKLPSAITYKRHGMIPANYHLTFSLSEINDKVALRAIEAGFNVAVPMRIKKGAPPATFSGYPVIDGDKHDFRFLDPKGGHIVALSPKGQIAKNHLDSGFIKEIDYVIA